MQYPNTSRALTPAPAVFQTFDGGMRDRDHPSQLLPNQYAYGKNIEIRESGLYKTRRGRTNRAGSPGSSPQGAVWYEPSAGSGMILQVNSGKVWQWSGSGSTWTRIDSGFTASNTSDPVNFAILNGRLYIFFGSTDNVRSWDGLSATLTDEGNTNTDPPRGLYPCVQEGRICASGTSSLTDHVFFSDIYDGQAWDRSANNKRNPTDGSEATLANAAYRKTQILSMTRNSTHLWDVSGSSVSSFSRITLDPKVGCIAHRSLVVVGDDAFFLSGFNDVRTIKRTQQDQAFGVSLPISYLNPNLMARINSRYSSKAAGIYFDNYYLLAVPLDNAQYNSGVIVFDLLHQMEGNVPVMVGEWTNMRPLQWVIAYFNSTPTLYYIDAVDGSLYSMLDSEFDDGEDIESEVHTRAADWQAPLNEKSIRDGAIQVLDTYGTIVISYAKDDQSFTSLLTKAVGSSGSFLPITLPFTLSSGGVLTTIPLCFYKRGKSRNWQMKIAHSGGVINLKLVALNAWVEAIRTRSL